MNPIYRLKLSVLVRKFLQEKLSRKIVYSLVIMVFIFGEFIFMFRAFAYLSKYPIIGPIISDKIISFSFFIFFSLLFMSNALTSLSTFFRSPELDFLISTPTSDEDIFSLKLIETIFYSSWATIVGGIPLIFAYILSNKGSAVHLLLSLIPLGSFILIPAGFGVFLVLLFKKISPKIDTKKLAVILSIIVAFIVFLYIKTSPYSFRIPFTDNLNVLTAYLQRLKFSNIHFPNVWLMNALKAILSNDGRAFFIWEGMLFSLSLSSLFLAMGFAYYQYRDIWLEAETGYKSRIIPVRLYKRTVSPIISIVIKDMKIFIRTPTQWAQSLIIGVLLILYTISLRRTPLYFSEPFWLTVFALINAGFVGYITATLSVRFVYPAISLEGKTLWILLSSPVPPIKILFSKYIFYLILEILMAETVVIFSNIALTPYLIPMLISSILAFFFAIASVSVSVCLGTVFAEFEEKNPAKIASGAGALLSASILIFYIAISIGAFAYPMNRYIKARILQNSAFMGQSILWASIFFIIITGIVIFIPLNLALSNLRRGAIE